MSSKIYTCLICRKRCDNAGALKIHMKLHKRPEPQCFSLLKWVEFAPVKSTAKKESPAIEMKPMKRMRQLKLREDPPATVVSNPVPPRLPRRPRQPQQKPINNSPFVALADLVAADLDKRSPHFRVARVCHFQKLKSDYPMLDKKMYHPANENKRS